MGGFNGDGRTIVADVLLLLKGLLNNNVPEGGDVNEDRIYSIVDIIRVLVLIFIG